MKPNKNVNYPKRFDKLCCANKIRGLLKLLTARGGGGKKCREKATLGGATLTNFEEKKRFVPNDKKIILIQKERPLFLTF